MAMGNGACWKMFSSSLRARSSSVWALSDCLSARTREVVSVTVTSTPPTSPLSSRMGLYEKVK
jgi:hypothetical protein